MTSPFVWGSIGSVVNLLTTELNALANGTITAAGPEINNTTVKQGRLYLHLASAAFVAPSILQVFFVPSGDLAGSNYPTVTSAAAWGGPNYLAATILINGSTAAQNENVFVPYVPLGKFKTFAVTGASCPTLGATLNTLDLYPTPDAY